MKKLLTAVFLFIATITYGQYTPQNRYGDKIARVIHDSAIFIPTGCGKPLTIKSTTVKNGALFFDSCFSRLWIYNPKSNNWDTIKGSGIGNAYTLTKNITKDSIILSNGILTWKVKDSIGGGGIITNKWSLQGDSISNGDFLGTTNNENLVFKVNNILSGKIDLNNGNTSFGESSLLNPSNGQGSNTAIGKNSLQNITTGIVNVGVGVDALKSTINGLGNTAVGYDVLSSNINGGGNTALGMQSLKLNQSGAANVAIGRDALGNNTIGGANTAIGNRAGMYNTNQSNQIFLNAGVDYGSYTGDTTQSPIWIKSASTNINQRIKINGEFQINNSSKGAGKVLTSDAVGNATWQTISGGGASTFDSTTANNGLTLTGKNVQLGGNLIQATTITNNANPLTIATGGTALNITGLTGGASTDSLVTINASTGKVNRVNSNSLQTTNLQIATNNGNVTTKNIETKDSLISKYLYVKKSAIIIDKVLAYQKNRISIRFGASVDTDSIQTPFGIKFSYSKLLNEQMGESIINKSLGGTSFFAGDDSMFMNRLNLIPVYNSTIHSYLFIGGSNHINDARLGADYLNLPNKLNKAIDTANIIKGWPLNKIIYTTPSIVGYYDNLLNYNSLKNFATIGKATALNKGVIVIDVFDEMTKFKEINNTPLLCADSVHPSQEGHFLIFSIIAHQIGGLEVEKSITTLKNLTAIGNAKFGGTLTIGEIFNKNQNSSIVNIFDTTRGLLIPRMTTVQRNAIVNPAQSLLIFNTTTNRFNFYANPIWQDLISSSFNAWGLSGNSNTIFGTNFIGTADNNDLAFKIDNTFSGAIRKSNYLTSIGYDGLSSNTTGQYSVNIGAFGLKNNTTGERNVNVGYGGLFNTTTGNGNVAIGQNSGSRNSTGSNNLFLGEASGYGNTTNNNQIFLNTLFRGGNYTDDISKSPIYIVQDLNLLNQKITLNGTVGIGTTSPDSTLHIVGGLKFQNGTQGAGKYLRSDAIGGATWQAIPTYTPFDSSTIYAKVKADSIVDANKIALKVNIADTANMLTNYAKKQSLIDTAADIRATVWGIKGNAGTNPSTDFIGTTDVQPLNFRVNNVPFGILDISTSSVGFGGSALSSSTGVNVFGAGEAVAKQNTGSDVIAIGAQAGIYNTFNNITLLGSNVVASQDNVVLFEPTQDVGIGTLVPTSKLDVGGMTTTQQIKITTGAGLGRVLTDATGDGTAEWATLPTGLATTNFIYNEEYTGSTTLAITLANTPSATKYTVFKNGIRLPLSEFSITTNTLTLSSRDTGDNISINYIK